MGVENRYPIHFPFFPRKKLKAEICLLIMINLASGKVDGETYFFLATNSILYMYTTI